MPCGRSNKKSYSQRQLYKKSASCISIHVCVPQCVQKRVLPAIYAQRSHLDPLDPVNPAPRGGLTGSKSEGSGSGFDQSKGCESSGSGGSGSRSYQTNMPYVDSTTSTKPIWDRTRNSRDRSENSEGLHSESTVILSNIKNVEFSNERLFCKSNIMRFHFVSSSIMISAMSSPVLLFPRTFVFDRPKTQRPNLPPQLSQKNQLMDHSQVKFYAYF